MKNTRIEIENSFDCTVTAQIVETTVTDHTGTHKAPDEICLLIEDEKGSHIAIFTPEQAAVLERAIGTLRMQMAVVNG